MQTLYSTTEQIGFVEKKKCTNHDILFFFSFKAFISLWLLFCSFFVLKQQFLWHHTPGFEPELRKKCHSHPGSWAQSQGWYPGQVWTTVSSGLRDLKMPFIYLAPLSDSIPLFHTRS